MDFDFGEVLRRAWQLTWKHKALWFFSVLPVIPVILYFPLIFYFFLSEDVTERVPNFLSNPTFIAIIFAIIVFTAAIALVLQVFSKSASTFGIVQIESGNATPTFGEVSRGGRTFFWRTLGAMLLTSVVAMVFFAVFSACISAVGFATLGLGSLIGQLLFLPATLLIYAITEQTQAAIVADAMSPTSAIEHAWELVMEHLGIFAIVTVVLYFGLSIVSSIVMLPVMAPLLFVVLGRFSTGFSDPAILRIALLCFVGFLPVSLILQAGAMLYVKSAFTITYLRLTRLPKSQPLPENSGGNIVQETT